MARTRAGLTLTDMTNAGKVAAPLGYVVKMLPRTGEIYLLPATMAAGLVGLNKQAENSPNSEESDPWDAAYGC